MITDPNCKSCIEDGPVISGIFEKRKALSPQRALLVGISGIDAAAKGFVTARIAESLQERGSGNIGFHPASTRSVQNANAQRFAHRL